MIYILGARHSLQVWTNAKRCGESPDASREAVEAFESYLADVTRSLNAEIIAEEASDEFVASHGHSASSVAKGVATRLGIHHLFCDPDTGQRRALGLKVGEELRAHAMTVSNETGRDWVDIHGEELRKQFPIREAFWLRRLEAFNVGNISVIFVCGADHVGSFQTTLNARRISTKVVARDWPDIAEACTASRLA